MGDLGRGKGARGDAWGFPIAAAKRGCTVHTYDPTIAIRERQAAGAKLIAGKLAYRSKHNPNNKWHLDDRGVGNLTFHFAGLGAGQTTNTTNSCM